MFKTLLLLSALLLSASYPEPTVQKQLYECTGIESSNPQDWKCTYLGKPLTPAEQTSFNLNIANGKKVKQNG